MVQRDKTIKVSGMHCKSCEMILESKIKEVPGVKKVSAHTSRSEVKVVGDYDVRAVEKAIKDAGYKVGIEEKTFFTREKQVYLDLILYSVIFAIVYNLLGILGISKLLPTISSGSYSYGVVILLGMTAGFSTCMALVGGLVLGFTARYREKHPEISGIKSFIPNIYFNIGRVVGFFILGGILGEIGTVVKISSLTNGWLLLLVSLVMLLIGVQLTEISPLASKINFTMPKFISNLVPVSKLSGLGYTHASAVISGALTFFLPCGFTQAVQLVAVSSGSFVSGGTLMSLFALGTTPGLLLVGSIASFAQGETATKIFRFMGVVVVTLAFLNLMASFNLIGIHFPKIDLSQSDGGQKSGQVATVSGSEQVVNMNVTSYGYSPSSFTIKKGVPVRWIIDVKDISTCASYILFPEMNIQKLLKRGENTLTFTPTKAGTLKFSCSMGMYTGEFNVVE